MLRVLLFLLLVFAVGFGFAWFADRPGDVMLQWQGNSYQTSLMVVLVGVVALVAGMIWGSKLGVQFSLATVALRALPVVILGGLTSVPGAIIGGLIIGVGEKLSEVYLGPYVGGGIEIWFAYVLALVFLLFRPQGLFGEKIIDRV